MQSPRHGPSVERSLYICFRISCLSLRSDHSAGVRQYVSNHGGQYTERRYDASGNADGSGAQGRVGERGHHHRGGRHTGPPYDYDKCCWGTSGSSSNIVKRRQRSDEGHAGRSY